MGSSTKTMKGNHQEKEFSKWPLCLNVALCLIGLGLMVAFIIPVENAVKAKKFETRGKLLIKNVTEEVMEEIRDDVVFYLETTTEELMTIKPQPRIAKVATADALNQTSTTSSTQKSTTPKITKRKHFKKRKTNQTSPETSTQAENTTAVISSAPNSQWKIVQNDKKPISDTKTTFTYFVHNPFRFMCGGFKSFIWG